MPGRQYRVTTFVKGFRGKCTVVKDIRDNYQSSECYCESERQKEVLIDLVRLSASKTLIFDMTKNRCNSGRVLVQPKHHQVLLYDVCLSSDSKRGVTGCWSPEDCTVRVP